MQIWSITNVVMWQKGVVNLRDIVLVIRDRKNAKGLF